MENRKFAKNSMAIKLWIRFAYSNNVPNVFVNIKDVTKQ